MPLLLDSEYQITSSHIRDLLTLSLHNNSVTITNSLLNINVNTCLLADDSIASAFSTSSSHTFSLTAASIAVSLHLHLHAKTHLNILHDDTPALAIGTGLEFAVFGTSSTTVTTVDISIDV